MGRGGASRLSVRFDLFSFLPAAARDDFLAAVKPRVVRSGSTVYTQTDVEESMYRIVRGEISLSRLREDGRALLIYVMPRGDCFGVSTLIDGGGQPHTATARSDVLLQVLDKASFEAIRRAHRSFDDAMLRLLCRDIRLLSVKLTDAALDDLPARLAERLLEIAHPGPHDGATVQVAQSELALMCGASRQSVNRVLKQFEEQGVVRLSYGVIQLSDVKRLATIRGKL